MNPRLLTQTATMERFIEIKGGSPTYQDAETVRCRIEKTAIVQLSGVMAQHTSNTRMFMVGEPVPPRSRVTYNGTVYVVGDCKECYTTKLDHLELMLI